MDVELNRETIAKAYARWAPVYDLVFGAVFERGRAAATAASSRLGGRVLEVGVGTGISLPYYSSRSRVVGIDLSEPMLRRARRRVAERGLRNVEGLVVMDAESLAFPDGAFDVVVAQYVINTVPDPEAVLDEITRVLRPGGEIVLLSRVGADAGPRRAVEQLLTPMVQKLGWRSEFPWEMFQRWLERTDGIHLIERRPVPPLGHFCLIRFGKSAVPGRRRIPDARRS
jgi:phosphatidylethanolamine/phosphatidyl-N-methylethanolamine N-methyltransferase